MNNIEKFLKDAVLPKFKPYQSVEIESEQDTTDGSGRTRISISFDDKEAIEDPTFVGSPKLFKKAFFSDTHSNVVNKARKAFESNGHIWMNMARISIPSDPYHILDDKGEKRVDQDGNAILAHKIVVFVMEHEDPFAEYRRQCKRITREKRWATIQEDHEEEETAEALKGK
jgi:hypothetical protein